MIGTKFCLQLASKRVGEVLASPQSFRKARAAEVSVPLC